MFHDITLKRRTSRQLLANGQVLGDPMVRVIPTSAEGDTVTVKARSAGEVKEVLARLKVANRRVPKQKRRSRKARRQAISLKCNGVPFLGAVA